MLTLFYVPATFLQSWRIKSICSKIAQQLSQQASVCFYVLPPDTEDGYVASLATSDLCVNRNAAKVSEILWLQGHNRGCALSPMQTVHITSWISFPETPLKTPLLPFAHNESSERLLGRLAASRRRRDVLQLLLETEINPCNDYGSDVNVVRIEEYGKLIAWRIDVHLSVLIETDVEHFTKLLISTYLQNKLLINDQLPVLRIESVNYRESPQPFELLSTHLRKATRTKARLEGEEWQKHLSDLRALSVLAHQATEFEQNKLRAESKTSTAVKPDLIPAEKKAAATAESGAHKTKEAGVTVTPTKATQLRIEPGKEEKSAVTTKPSTTTTATQPKHVTPSKTSLADEVKHSKAVETKQTTANSSPAAVVQSAKSTTAQINVSAEQGAKALKQEGDVGTTPSLGKMKAKPTEIKKPGGTVGDSRFKTTKVSEPVQKSTTSLASEPPFIPCTVTAAAAVINTTISTLAKSSPTKTSSSSTKGNEPSQTSPLKAATSPSISSPSSSSTQAKNKDSMLSNGAAASKRPSLKRQPDSLRDSKPLNILVYSDSVSARESAVNTLKDILEKDMYTIYALTPQQVTQKYWLENTALLVVCGAVPTNIGEILVDYFLRGGRVLSLCSDILHFILPNYRTAEVREHELVQFSYDKWQKIRMMHHIFCYQHSPVKKNFSTDSDESAPANSRKPALVCPRSIELKDLHGELHSLEVKVLGTEETWNTPSLLLANSTKSGGRAVFSQVHLETSPSQFEMDESKYAVLKDNEKVRLEIFADLLSKHLDVSVHQAKSANAASSKCIYQQAYFLGRHESKFELLNRLKPKSTATADNIISTSKLTMQFCGKNDKPISASTNVLPILIHSCPEDFSTVEYFDDLKTQYIGRLLIYAPVVSSSMNVISELELTHGLAVLVREQTEGIGRSNNQWISPLGCAMFSVQLHIPMKSPLGSRLPLIQHLIGAAMVNTLRGNETYKNLDIALKWPNDIYANGIYKIGGLVVKTTLAGETAIVNIGCGINLDNEKPTTCINALITEYNRVNRTQLPRLKYEEFIALQFNEIERLLEIVQTDDFEQFYKLYYNLWMHNEQTVKICDKDGKQREAKIIGVDDYGYLKVKLSDNVIETVLPDGNSFDILKGLIVPKFDCSVK